MRRIIKLLNAILFLPLYVYRTHERLEELKKTIWRLKRFVELSVHEMPALIPRGFQPRHPRNLRRIGGDSDGGYLVPEETIRATEVLVSYGIDFDWEFERAFSEVSGAKVFAYDRSTIDRLAEADETERLRFNTFFDGKHATFHAAYIGNGEDSTVRIAETLRAHKNRRVLMKFDIEGAEYSPQIFEELLSLPENVIGVIAEFHAFPDNLERVRKLIDGNRFHLVHLHVNNVGGIADNLIPNLVELTLIRDNYFLPSGQKPAYPLDLDRPCRSSQRDMRIHFEGWNI
jgi:hypothetical protein